MQKMLVVWCVSLLFGEALAAGEAAAAEVELALRQQLQREIRQRVRHLRHANNTLSCRLQQERVARGV